MDATDIIARIKTDVEATRSSGHSWVSIDGLERYLDSLAQHATTPIETQALDQQRLLAGYDVRAKWDLEMFKSVIDAGKEALNAAILINGGAVIALLGFLSSAATKGVPKALGLGLTDPLLYFGSGVLLSAIAFAGRYLTQYCYQSDHNKTGIGFHAATVLMATSTYVAFGCGVFKTYVTFQMQFGP